VVKQTARQFKISHQTMQPLSLLTTTQKYISFFAFNMQLTEI